MRHLFILLALLLTTAGAQDEPPAAEIPGMTSPASDKEETGILTDVLPERVDQLTLPEGEPHAGLPDAGGGLFPDESLPDSIMEMPVEPGSPPLTPDVSAGAPPEALPPEVAASCFGSAPPPPLHDPQQLLTPAQAASLRTLLRDSLNARGSFQTSVVVLKPSQQIPVTLNPPELLHRWYGRNKGLIILYFFGQPDRTQAFFSPETRQHHRTEDLRQVIEFGVREAARMDTPLTQLQRFCYKTAARLDRLHRFDTVTPPDEPFYAPVAAIPVTSLWWAFAVGVQAAAFLCAAVWWWRRHRSAAAARPGDTIHLPEQDPVCRLGGPHSGGSGAVMQFGSAGQHP